MNVFIVLALLSALSDPSEVTDRIDSTVVVASRAGRDTPIPNVTIDKEELRLPNPSYSLPLSISGLPSVVSAGEGGTGIGYTSLRIRGVPGSQTIVSLNGIALNDAEDQEVFWANIPSLSNYLGSVQVQRGLGTTVSGPGAFGAAVNMLTDSAADRPSGGASLSYGAFHTFTSSVRASTGVLKCGFYADAAFSYNSTDGYRYGAFGNVYSVFANLGWKGARDEVRATFLHGNQRTGITWEGISQEQYERDRRFNPAEGNTDNYRQSHFQLNWKHRFLPSLDSDVTLNYTDGYGYYEYSPRRDIQDNGLWVLRAELKYKTRALSMSGGVYLSSYEGDHIGRSGESELYSNKGAKREADAWVRAEWAPWYFRGSSLYADLQYRGLVHRMNGPDEYGQVLAYDRTNSFFNPRVGANVKLSAKNNLFVSAALGHREPSRSDIQSSLLAAGSSGLKPEKMLDFELGHRFEGYIWKASATVFAMEYFDMLVETGYVDMGGYAIKRNVDNAFRRGVELAGELDCRLFKIEGNISLSSNKIRDVGDIIMSPAVVGMLRWTQLLWTNGKLSLGGKLVGDQYWQNGGSSDCRIPAYCVFDFMLRHDFIFVPGLSAALYVDNLFNHRYYAYANMTGVFAQPPINCMFRLEYSF